MGSEMTSFFENAKSIRIGNKEVKSITTSTGTIWKKEEDNYLLTINSSKSILSYADSESATITATLTNNNVAVNGETLTYTIKHNNTTIDTGSDTTDANGQITFTYASAGIGDVTVEVDYGILLQETYEVEDTWKYWTNTWTQGSSNRQIPLNLALPSSFKINWKSKTTSYAQVILGKTYGTLDYIINHNSSNNMSSFQLLKRVNSSSAQTVTATGNSYPSSQTYDLEYQYANGQHTLLVDGVQVFSVNDMSVEITELLYLSIRDATLSNIKVKPL